MKDGVRGAAGGRKGRPYEEDGDGDPSVTAGP